MTDERIPALKGARGGARGGRSIPVHTRACEAVMAIMKDRSCTTKEALESLKKDEELLWKNEEKLAQHFMGWLNKRYV